jgi:hypothetical protein
VVPVVLFVAALALPHPEGIWYFGHRPQWMVAIDHGGLTIARSSNVASLGWFPLLVAKLVVYGLPVWLIWRFGFRSRRGRTSAG